MGMIDFGICQGEFLERYHGKQIFVKRGALAGFKFEWSELNRAVWCTQPKNPHMVLRNPQEVPEAEYVEEYIEFGRLCRRIKRIEFYRMLRDGATLILNRLETQSIEVRNLCNDIARFTGIKTVANGYLSFSGDSAFGNHWDSHDVFAVQLMGKKRWTIYSPTFDLPLESQTSAMSGHTCPETPCFDGVLEAGDLVYIPRGWWHNANAVDLGETFHITVGLHPPQIDDYIRWLFMEKLSNHKECRQSLGNQNRAKQILEEAAKTIYRELIDGNNIKRFLAQVSVSEKSNSSLALEKGGRRTACDFPDGSRLQAALGMMFVPSDGCVLASGIRFNVNETMYRILEQLVEMGIVTVGELKASLPFGNIDAELHELLVLDLVELW